MDSPPRSPVGWGKAVPRLRRFRFGILQMNHPPFPPPGLLSGLLRPRPQWPASRPEQHRPCASGRPGPGHTAEAPPGCWSRGPAARGLGPGRDRSRRAARTGWPHDREAVGGSAAPTQAPSPQEQRVGPRVHWCALRPRLVSKQLQRWKEEALLPYPRPICTPKLKAGHHPRSLTQGPGLARTAASAAAEAWFHRRKLRPREAEEPAGVTPPHEAGTSPGPSPGSCTLALGTGHFLAQPQSVLEGGPGASLPGGR
ncbi:uncharacterized protein LOC142862634 [Microcebus murinus]|uniref:uncharacterized protein LOC142862634 n=1 Tax=Microcebus murinus TaxID=30608 RepID=UPI003F6A632A